MYYKKKKVYTAESRTCWRIVLFFKSWSYPFFVCLFFYMTTNKVVGNLTTTSILRWIPQFCVCVSVQLTSGVFLRRAYLLLPLIGRLQNTNRLQDLDWPVKFCLPSTKTKCIKMWTISHENYACHMLAYAVLFTNHCWSTIGWNQEVI